MLKEESAFEPSYDGLSDAENVMLLHRDALDPRAQGGAQEDAAIGFSSLSADAAGVPALANIR